MLVILMFVTSVFAGVPLDSYQWLEEVEGKKAMEWVTKQNEVSLKKLETDPRFQKLQEDAEKILNAPDKLADGQLFNGFVYNFWQDEKHVRGLWRKAPIDSYKSGSPVWETLLDIDALAKQENENWVFKGSFCFEPEHDRCMVSLSRGGKDAAVYREFLISKKQFVKDGFEIPEMKTYVNWHNENTLLVSASLTKETTTDSGYGRVLRVWNRGNKFLDAPIIFEALQTDVGVWTGNAESDGRRVTFIIRNINTLENEYTVLDQDLKAVHHLNLPKKASLHGFYKGLLILSCDENWVVKNQKRQQTSIEAGKVVAFDLNQFVKSSTVEQLHVLFNPGKTTALQNIKISKNFVYLTYLDNVNSKIVRKFLDGGKWTEKEISVVGQGSISIYNTASNQDDILLSNTGFLTPTQVLFVGSDGVSKVVQRLPARFNSENLIVEQKFAKSLDGTRIPFFVVRNKNSSLNGTNPTVLYGYGGFDIAMLPSYRTLQGKLWLERGGSFVLANIRGGSEFGPNWHLSAVLENRNKCYEDFIAVAEELIKLKYTSPKKLAIQGGSNGGLLVSTVMVMRPDLFGSVVSEVPLTDMLRFHKLLAGASWVGEYGSPEDQKIKDFWTKYSPYQNVKPSVSYPPVFFVTSTKDDRVHPGHARKMAMRMMEFGKDVSYFENTEGGHAASANLLQLAKRNALIYTFLSEKLGLDQNSEVLLR